MSCVFLANPDVFSQSKYVKKYGPIADSLGKEYGIPRSIILAVAILESGSGTSRNAKLLNNHFGIVGKNNLLKSRGIKSVYKQYPSVLASYADFCRVLRKKKYYKTLKGNSNYALWVDAISKAGYSEVPEIWKKRVLEIIRINKLAI
jgi:flagellum-specific peptidoglycan hydrolase FlgJ